MSKSFLSHPHTKALRDSTFIFGFLAFCWFFLPPAQAQVAYTSAQTQVTPQTPPAPAPVRLRQASPILNENKDIDAAPPTFSWYTRFFDLVFKRRHPDDPSYTLKAPFIRPGDLRTPTATAMGLPFGEDVASDQGGDLSAAHRSEDQVGGWLTGRVSDILDVSGANWNDHLKLISSSFTKPALDAYSGWMTTSDVLGRIVANNQHVHAYVDDVPLLLNQGVVDGRYRWLYEVHATLTFLMDGTSYEGNTTAPQSMNNVKLTVRVQVGRVTDVDEALGEDDDNPDRRITASRTGIQPEENQEGLVLESWDVRRSDYQ